MTMHFTIGGNGRDVTGAMTAAEAIERAGLDWTTHTERIRTESGTVITGRRCKAVVRDDTGDVLGIVGKKHDTINNRTCFDFMDCVSGQAGGVTYETAGYLGRGERVWMLARTDGILRVGPTPTCCCTTPTTGPRRCPSCSRAFAWCARTP
jgi:hypothetical protein